MRRAFWPAAFVAASLLPTPFLPLALANTIIDGGVTESVPGTQSPPWNISDQLIVGNSGTGTLNISGGSVSNAGIGMIGNAAGSTGTVTVAGADSQWTNSAGLRVGNYGTGTLEITGGGVVSNTNLAIVGNYAGSSGTVMVDGSGSKFMLDGTGSAWDTSGHLYVGYSGTGTLTITGGGSVSNAGVGFIGYGAGSTSTVTVDGVDSQWTNSGGLRVGDRGTGTLEITGGGVVSNTRLALIGSVAGSNGMVMVDGNGSKLMVDGTGSTWDTSGYLIVGGAGTGTLKITGGGAVSNNNSVIGNNPTGNGTVTVDGPDSTWTNNGVLVVASEGTGTLEITDGGSVSNTDGSIGVYSTSSTGTVTVDGSGSQWTNTGALVVGNLGTGSLTIKNSGFVSAAAGISIGGQGTLTLLDTGSIADSSDVSLATGGLFDLSGTASGATIKTLANTADGQTGTVSLGDKTLTVTGGGAFGGVLSGAGGGLTLTGGTLILSGNNTYSGATTISVGRLEVTGSIEHSASTVVMAGGVLTGTGTVGNTTIQSGGKFQPGDGTPSSSITVSGNLEFQPGAWYGVNIDPDTSSLATVSGTAALGDVSVSAKYAAASGYVEKRYTILTAAGGVDGEFNELINSNLPAGFQAALSYDPNHAYLDLSLSLVHLDGLSHNQQNVAGALVDYFDRTSRIPAVFGTLTASGLTQVSGELATAVQQTGFDAMNQFMGAIASASGMERDGGICGDSEAKNPAREARSEACQAASRNVWATAYGGSRDTDGNAAAGSNDATGRVYGLAVGADYAISADTVAGVAVAGGSTNFDLANGLGSGRSGLFQAGLYGRHHMGPAYLSGMLAYGWQDITNKRTVTIDGFDRLQADFDTNAFSGRLEGGWGFTAAWGNLAPYAAAQFTTVDLPGYSERATTGGDTFALRYDSQTLTAWRSELGLRAGKTLRLADGSLSLGGRLAWAHDFDTDRDMTATFQTLPGATFTVNGAEPDHDAALVTIAAEMIWGNGWSVGLAFDGDFSGVSRSYTGSGLLRYRW